MMCYVQHMDDTTLLTGRVTAISRPGQYTAQFKLEGIEDSISISTGTKEWSLLLWAFANGSDLAVTVRREDRWVLTPDFLAATEVSMA